ncbi:MAG: response regulator [Gammaproteobacteria bacterium]|nr:response regulator [Gammaproteobacteria bacterium]MDH5728348.1 response regulator [Gammaproteobacteria bacterium]
MKILFVDDNADLADAYHDLLEDEHDIEVVYNGRDAMDLITKESFDVMFIDIKLPDINGMQILQQALEQQSQAKIIMMTGFRIEQIIENLVSDKSIHVFVEHYEVPDLVSQIERSPVSSIFVITGDAQKIESIQRQLSESSVLKSIVINEMQKELTNQNVDNVILNNQTPLIYSINQLQTLEKHFPSSRMVVLKQLNKTPDQRLESFKSLKVSGCLYKPFNIEDLTSAIQKLAG